MKSIVQKNKECYFCKRTDWLERHHIMMGKWRRSADEDGLTVWLCHEHHTGNSGVHRDPEKRLLLQQKAEQAYISIHSYKEWMERYGKNYLEEI